MIKDAFDYSMSADLSQIDADGKERMILCSIKKFIGVQKNYLTSDKKLLVIEKK